MKKFPQLGNPAGEPTVIVVAPLSIGALSVVDARPIEAMAAPAGIPGPATVRPTKRLGAETLDSSVEPVHVSPVADRVGSRFFTLIVTRSPWLTSSSGPGRVAAGAVLQ